MTRDGIEAIFPLSPMQAGVLFHTLYEPETGIYLTQLTGKLPADLDLGAFRKAWDRAVERHAALRSFIWRRRETPLQVVRTHARLHFEELDWRTESEETEQTLLASLLEADRRKGFDLSDAPLMRVTVVRVATGYRIVWSFHQVLLDGWSVSVVWNDVARYYPALRRGEDSAMESAMEPASSYREYVTWLARQDMGAAERFWRKELEGFAEPTPLQTETGLRSFEEGPVSGEEAMAIPPDTASTLSSFARQHRLTLNTILQGAWAVLLGRYAGEEDVVFGATVSGRPATLPGVESMVGLLVNTLPVRVKIPRDARIAEWLGELQKRQAEVRQFEYSPLASVQGWSDVPRGVPLFQSILAFENYPMQAAGEVDALRIEDLRSIERTNYPIVLEAVPGRELSLKITFDRRRFETVGVRQMLGHLAQLLEGMASGPERRVSELLLLTDAERHLLLVEWNRTAAEYPGSGWLPERLQAQAEKTPDAVAVEFDGDELTYGELNRRANRLAHRLRRLGVGPDVLVALAAERSFELVVGLLAVVKAGGAYVPLDPGYPRDRLALLLDDTDAPVILTQTRLADRLPSEGRTVVLLDAPAAADEPTSDLDSPIQGENAAYVIYTSGSTGRPKGVVNTHRGILNRLQWMQDAYGLTPGDRVLQKTPYTFDVSVWEFFWPLLTGARLVLARPEGHRDSAYLADLIARRGITTLHFVPSMLHAFLQEKDLHSCQSLKRVFSSGEALSPELAALFSERTSAQLHNLYGPTEAAVDVTYFACPPENAGPVIPIGRPIANTRIYVRDPYGNPVPIGVPGEVGIGGIGLARGYLRRPDLTAERFVPDPFAGEPGARLYRTGDLGRWLADGNLAFLQRLDDQIKVRGFRVEPGEIEAALRQHPAVGEAVVVAREDVAGDKRLVAYVVADEPPSQLIGDLRRLLKESLPEYMVPSAFVLLESLPLTPSGKLDRRALPAPGTARPHLEQMYAAPRTPVESHLAEIWRQVLGIERVGIHDNFFELGGHSLLAMQVVSQIRETFRIELPLRRLFESATPAELAPQVEAFLQAPGTTLPGAMERAARDRELPLSFAQQRLWFLQQWEPEDPSYNVPLAIRMSGALHVEALEKSLNAIIARHESLRTSFLAHDGVPRQVIAPAASVRLERIDGAGLSRSKMDDEVVGLALEEARRPFDLERGPLVRARLVKLDKEEHALLLSMHHIVTDGWSLSVLFRELASLYQVFSRNEPAAVPLPDLPIQYVDYAVWERDRLRGPVLDELLSYWRQQLAGSEPLNLPTAPPTSDPLDSRGALRAFRLSKDLSRSLAALSRREGVTLFMTLLAAFQSLLGHAASQEDVVVGTNVANRNRVEVEGLIGCFVNHLVMRTRLSGDLSFRELLQEVRETALGAYAHQELPFDKLVEHLQPPRIPGRTPLFQVLFVLQNAPSQELGLGALQLRSLDVPFEAAKFDLALFLNEGEDGLWGNWMFKTHLYSPEFVERISRAYAVFLHRAVEQPEASLTALHLQDEAPHGAGIPATLRSARRRPVDLRE